MKISSTVEVRLLSRHNLSVSPAANYLTLNVIPAKFASAQLIHKLELLKVTLCTANDQDRRRTDKQTTAVT